MVYPQRARARALLAFPLAFVLGAIACEPTAGYRTPSLTSSNQYPPPPRSVEGPSPGSMQVTPPRRGVPGSETRRPRQTPPECTQASDCVPATCCHPTGCAPRAHAPQCDGVMCSQECRAHTLDCGGGCACEGGVCSARLASGPAAGAGAGAP